MKWVYLHCRIAVSYTHWSILIHNLSVKVDFLFHGVFWFSLYNTCSGATLRVDGGGSLYSPLMWKIDEHKNMHPFLESMDIEQKRVWFVMIWYSYKADII